MLGNPQDGRQIPKHLAIDFLDSLVHIAYKCAFLPIHINPICDTLKIYVTAIVPKYTFILHKEHPNRLIRTLLSVESKIASQIFSSKINIKLFMWKKGKRIICV